MQHKVSVSHFWTAFHSMPFRSNSANSHVIDSSQPVASTNFLNGAWNAPYRATGFQHRRVDSSASFNDVGCVLRTICKYLRLRLFIAHACTVCPVLIALLMMMPIFPKSAVAGPKDQGNGPLPLVTVVEVNERDVNPPAEYIGHVEAIQTVDLRARVEGFLEQVMFREGSDVHAGDLLYVIEQAPYQARVDADKALVAQAEAILTKANQYLKLLPANKKEADLCFHKFLLSALDWLR